MSHAPKRKDILSAEEKKLALVSIDFPIGQRQRRAEGIPVLVRKFEDALAGQFPRRRVEQILAMVKDVTRFEATPIHEFMDLLAV